MTFRIKCFTRPVRKREMAEAIPCSLSTLNRYIESGRIAEPGLRYSQRLIFFTAWQANEILAGRSGEIPQEKPEGKNEHAA